MAFCPRSIFHLQCYRLRCSSFARISSRRRTKVQQLTCNIDLSSSFYYLFFSFVLIELKPFVLKGKVLGEKFCKSVKKCERKCEELWNDFALKLLPFIVFPWICRRNPKGDGRKGMGGRGRDRKCHKLSWRLSQIVVTNFMTTYDVLYDVLWRFMSMEQRDGNCHKMSQVVVNVVNCRDVCRKLSWHFFSRPLPAVPFGFRRIWAKSSQGNAGSRRQT